jgi:hypothetical protein
MTQLGGFTGNVRDALTPWDVALPASASTFYRANLPRFGLSDGAGDTGHVALATGVMTAVAVKLVAGDVITNVNFVTGATAGATITDSWAALYGPGATAATQLLLAQSTTTGAGALAANTVITKPLATAYTVTATGIYFVGINVTATTVPTLLGTVVAPIVVTGERALSKLAGTGLSTTAPANLGVSAGVREFCPFVVLT